MVHFTRYSTAISLYKHSLYVMTRNYQVYITCCGSVESQRPCSCQKGQHLKKKKKKSGFLICFMVFWYRDYMLVLEIICKNWFSMTFFLFILLWLFFMNPHKFYSHTSTPNDILIRCTMWASPTYNSFFHQILFSVLKKLVHLSPMTHYFTNFSD